MDLPIVVNMNPMLYTDMSGQKWAVSGEHWIEVPDTLTLGEVGKYMIYEGQGSKGNPYTVSDNGGTWTCSCPGFGWRRKCKHVEAQKNESR